jgi:hypothetical protein
LRSRPVAISSPTRLRRTATNENSAATKKRWPTGPTTGSAIPGHEGKYGSYTDKEGPPSTPGMTSTCIRARLRRLQLKGQQVREPGGTPSGALFRTLAAATALANTIFTSADIILKIARVSAARSHS